LQKISIPRNILAAIAVALFSLSISSCTVNQPTRPAKAIEQFKVGASWQTIQSDQKERRYLLYIPASYNGNTPVPLVLNFHGTGGNPSWQLAYSDFKKLAEEEGFITVSPSGQYLNLGRNSWNTVNDPDGVDDVQLVRDIIDDLKKRLAIDPKRIFATGMSGGARMTSRLACEFDDTLAAVAPVAGIQYPADCRAARAVPIITFHGEEDLVNTYVHSSRSPAYWTTGVEASLSGWVQRNGCAQNPEIEQISEEVSKLAWENCRDDTEIVFYRIKDGGHTWPGSSTILTQPWAGKTNEDIVASRLIWQFFEAHPLP